MVQVVNDVVTWLKQWFYDEDEIDTKVQGLQGQINNKASQSDLNTLSSAVSNKVDKISGKGLSTNDYTTAEKNKLNGIEAQANKTIVDNSLDDTSTNPVQNKVIDNAISEIWDEMLKRYTDEDINVSNSLINEFKNSWDITVSSSAKLTAVLTTLMNKITSKVDKIDGKGLSTNDYTTAEKNKLAGLSNYTHPSNHASTMIVENSSLGNLGTNANANQHEINIAVNNIIGDLLDVDFLKVVSTLPTASQDTLNSLYLVTKMGGATGDGYNIWVTVETSQGGSTAYSWEKVDDVDLQNISIDWSDITDNPFSSSTPSSFATSNHAHGRITNDGHIINASGTIMKNKPLSVDSNGVILANDLTSAWIFHGQALSNIGTNANATQSTINNAINTKIGTLNTNIANKQDIGDCITSIELVPKAEDNTGCIRLYYGDES